MKLKNYGPNMVEIEKDIDTKILYSYSTPVACITRKPYVGATWEPFKTSSKCSKTTTRNISKWFNHYFPGGILAREMGQKFFYDMAI